MTLDPPFRRTASVECVVHDGLQPLVEVLGLLELHHHRQEVPGALVRQLLAEEEPVRVRGSGRPTKRGKQKIMQQHLLL